MSRTRLSARLGAEAGPVAGAAISIRHAFVAGLAFAAAIGLATPLAAIRPAAAQTAPAAAPQAPADEDRLSQAQLEQILAPVALYPDDLLMQILIASTYPLEVVQAQRWLAQGDHGTLRGDALAQALNDQPWDPSVKSLLPFPDVLKLMNDQLEWTQRMGDAVLGQQEDVMNAVQTLRGRAQANGSLQSGPQQTVTVTQNVNVAPSQGSAVAPPPQMIEIAPTDPGQVYVPAYNPSVVYGSWPYPESPPYYYPPPVGAGVGNAILTGMAFAGSVAVVDSLWGWARPGWGRGDVDIDINRFNNINVNRNRITNNRWQHDGLHRHGVSYGSDRVRDRVGARRSGGGIDRSAAREQFRGRVQHAGGDHPNLGNRLAGRDGPHLGGNRPGGDHPNLAGRLPNHDGANRPNLGGHHGQGGNHPNLAGRLPNRDGANRPNLGGHHGQGGNHPNLANRRPGHEGANRPNLGGHRGQGGGARPALNRPNVQHRPSGRPHARPGATRQAPQGLRGVGQGGRERAAAMRGRGSRQGQPAAHARAQQRHEARAPRRGGGGGHARPHRGGGGGGRRHR